jgi:hypothetical protein
MDHAWRVPPSLDPLRLLADLVLAVVGVGIAAWLIPRQRRRVRQYGGRPVAEAVVIAAIVALVVALQPDLVSVEASLVLAILAVVVAFRPEDVVRLTGGPRIEWQALAEGTMLRQLVAIRADRRAAQHHPGVRAHLARLAALESPAASRYIELVRTTLFADPEGPGMSDRLAALAVEEARLRSLVGPRPAFEGGLIAVDEEPIRPSLRALPPAAGPTAGDAPGLGDEPPARPRNERY